MDVILADHDFTTADNISVHGEKIDSILHSGKSQLPQRDVEQCKQLSTVRIHVEKLIGHLKKSILL